MSKVSATILFTTIEPDIVELAPDCIPSKSSNPSPFGAQLSITKSANSNNLLPLSCLDSTFWMFQRC